jgi:drug/metabolite transporter (DMT)-like permease
LRRHPPVIGAIGLFTGMTITFSVLAVAGGLVVPDRAGTWLLVFFVALGPGALTMTLFSFAVPRLGATSFAILANAELVTVVAIGTLLLDEPMTPARAIGGALIAAGIVTHALWRKPLPAAVGTTAVPRPPLLARRGG